MALPRGYNSIFTKIENHGAQLWYILQSISLGNLKKCWFCSEGHPPTMQSFNFTQNCIYSKLALKCLKNKKVKNQKLFLGWKLPNTYKQISKMAFFHILERFTGLRFSEEISIFYLSNTPRTTFMYDKKHFQHLYVKFR